MAYQQLDDANLTRVVPSSILIKTYADFTLTTENTEHTETTESSIYSVSAVRSVFSVSSVSSVRSVYLFLYSHVFSVSLRNSYLYFCPANCMSNGRLRFVGLR